MVVKKRGLGRGLDALLSDVAVTPRTETESTATTAVGDQPLQELALTQLQRGRYQPRRDLEPQSLEELANSIRGQGVIQPIVVRLLGEERYEIIAGERRWKAAELAGLSHIPALVRDVPDEAAIAMALIENIQRENLNPMEEAVALQRLQTEFELTQQQMADAVGKSRSTIANLLRLMTLSDEVKRMLEYGDLEMGHARALLGLEGLRQIKAADEVVAKGLSVRETEQLVKRYQQGEAVTDSPAAGPQDPELEQQAGLLSRRFATPVSIKANARGKGRIAIDFKNREELDAILKLLG